MLPHPVCSQCCSQSSRLLLAFLNSLTSPPSRSINSTGFHSQLVSGSKFFFWFLNPNSTLSATSHRPLRSSDGLVLFVLRVRTTMAQTRSFATIGPSLQNALPSSLRLTLLSRSRSASLFLLNT